MSKIVLVDSTPHFFYNTMIRVEEHEWTKKPFENMSGQIPGHYVWVLPFFVENLIKKYATKSRLHPLYEVTRYQTNRTGNTPVIFTNLFSKTAIQSFIDDLAVFGIKVTVTTTGAYVVVKEIPIFGKIVQIRRTGDRVDVGYLEDRNTDILSPNCGLGWVPWKGPTLYKVEQ